MSSGPWGPVLECPTVFTSVREVEKSLDDGKFRVKVQNGYMIIISTYIFVQTTKQTKS